MNLTLKPAPTGHPVRLSAAVELDHPADAVAAVLLDWSHDHAWRAHVRSFTLTPPGPAVVGQRMVEDLRFAGLTFRTPTQVVATGPLTATYAGGSASVACRGTRTVTPLGRAQCRVETVLELRFAGAMRLVAPLLAPAYRRADAADLAALHQVMPELLPELRTTGARVTEGRLG